MCQYNKKILQTIIYDDVTKKKIKEHNPNWLRFHHHP